MTKVRIELRAISLLTALCVLAPGIAFARQPGRWNVDLAPINSWNATANGNLAINGASNTPLFANFSDGKITARGIAVHGEARKGKWGVIGDVNFVHLSSDVSDTAQISSQPITGTVQVHQVIFNGTGMFLIKPNHSLYATAGVRTMTLSPSVQFPGPDDGPPADIRGSNTRAAGVIGFIYRPKLDEHFTILTQADIGDGSAFTWSALGGMEFLIKPWIGVTAWYGALGIDTGNVPKSGTTPIGTVTGDSRYTLKLNGAAVGITFHMD